MSKELPEPHEMGIDPETWTGEAYPFLEDKDLDLYREMNDRQILDFEIARFYVLGCCNLTTLNRLDIDAYFHIMQKLEEDHGRFYTSDNGDLYGVTKSYERTSTPPRGDILRTGEESDQ